MTDVLEYDVPLVSRQERHLGGISVFRDRRAPSSHHVMRLVQSRHLVALQLSDGPIVSCDRLDGRILPLRRRTVRQRVTLVPAGTEWISDTEPQGGSEYLAVFLPGDVLEDDGASPVFPVEPALDLELPAVRSVLLAIAGDLREPVYGEMFLDGAVRMLAAQLGRHRHSPSNARRISPDLNRRLIRLIDDHLGQRLTVGWLAAQMEVSESWLTRSTRVAFGCSTYQLVLARRIQHAQQLLSGTQRPIVDIALACGFADHAHMSTAFRKITGMSPRQYRQALN